MWYQIINTRTSANEKICYSLFKRVKSLEAMTAYTYGVIAADCEDSYSIDDIMTDEHEINRFMSSLCAKSISPKEFLSYVIEYLDTM